MALVSINVNSATTNNISSTLGPSRLHASSTRHRHTETHWHRHWHRHKETDTDTDTDTETRKQTLTPTLTQTHRHLHRHRPKNMKHRWPTLHVCRLSCRQWPTVVGSVINKVDLPDKVVYSWPAQACSRIDMIKWTNFVEASVKQLRLGSFYWAFFVRWSQFNYVHVNIRDIYEARHSNLQPVLSLCLSFFFRYTPHLLKQDEILDQLCLTNSQMLIKQCSQQALAFAGRPCWK